MTPDGGSVFPGEREGREEGEKTETKGRKENESGTDHGGEREEMKKRGMVGEGGGDLGNEGRLWRALVT